MARKGTRTTRADGTAAAAATFVGRDDPLATLVRALGDGPALVLVQGEAGIGKTRLLRECLGSPGIQGRRVLVAACPPLPEPFPLGAVVDGVRRLRPDVAKLGLSPLGGALRSLFPEWTDELPPALEALEDPKETRHRLFGALTELVERLGVELLVVEDAHWADSATLEWLLTLTAAEPPFDSPGRSVVVTSRPWDVPDGSLLPRLTSRSPAGMPLVRVELEPLDAGQVRELVASMFGIGEVSEEFAEFLRERTGGIPLAVEETLLLLRDRDDIVHEDDGWSRRVLDELEVPATVRDSVLERVGRLRPEARRVLEAAAVLAGPANAATLTAAAGLDQDAGRRGLAAALASGLLQETDPGRYVFRHALDAQAIGDAIPVSECRQLHALAASALAAWDPPPVARLAHHYRESGDDEQWCRYAEQAADLALQSGDDRSAVVLLYDVLSRVDLPADRRAVVARKLGEAACYRANALGDLADRVADSLRTVLAGDDLPEAERGPIRLLLGRLLYTWETEAGLEMIEAALPDLGEHPGQKAQAMLYLASPFTTAWPAATHLEWLKRAAALAAHITSESERLSFTRHQASVFLLLGEEAGWQVAAEFPRDSSSATERRRIALNMVAVGQLAITWGRFSEADWRLVRAAEIGQADGYRQIVNASRLSRTYLDYYTGVWDGLADQAAELAGSPDAAPLERLEARLMLGLLDMASGRRRQAEERLRAVGDEFARRGLIEPPVLTQAAALARLLLAENAAPDAVRTTTDAMDVIATKGLWVWAADIAPVHVDGLIATERLGQAEELVCQFADGLNGRNAPAPVAALATCRAILVEAAGDPRKAAELFTEAAHAWAALPRPYDELLALERYGRCLLAVGVPDEALEVVTDVQQRLDELGAQWDADRVAHLLREHGVEVSRAWRGGRRGYGDQLSPRELDVVRLVSQGMTSRQVAGVLFLSSRTVDQHLRNAMRKLDVRSRTALAVAAAEAGLLSADTNER